MNPFEHGEVFVLDDGGEVDLDLGNYERFLDISLTSNHNITTGKVYRLVIEKERMGEYLGKTVQIIPHITNEIKNQIITVAEATGADVCIVELGGTVGDIESMPFLEAVRQMNTELGKGRELPVRPHHPGADHGHGGGAEDQADPALGQGAEGHRYSAGHHSRPGQGAFGGVASRGRYRSSATSRWRRWSAPRTPAPSTRSR